MIVDSPGRGSDAEHCRLQRWCDIRADDTGSGYAGWLVGPDERRLGDGTMQLALSEQAPNSLTGTWSATFRTATVFRAHRWPARSLRPATESRSVDPPPACGTRRVRTSRLHADQRRRHPELADRRGGGRRNGGSFTVACRSNEGICGLSNHRACWRICAPRLGLVWKPADRFRAAVELARSFPLDVEVPVSSRRQIYGSFAQHE